MGVFPIQMCSLCKISMKTFVLDQQDSLVGKSACDSETSIPEPKERWTERMEDGTKFISDIHKSSVTCTNTCVHMHACTTHTYALKNWKHLLIGTSPYFGPDALAARKLAKLIRWESNRGNEKAALASYKFFFSRKFISKYPEVSRQQFFFVVPYFKIKVFSELTYSSVF